MIIDTKITQDLFNYESIPCLMCEGHGEDENGTCEECDGTGDIALNPIEKFLTK